MGCPAGIGPEIILRYFSENRPTGDIIPVVLGDKGVLEKCGRDLSLPANCVPWDPATPIAQNTIPLLELSSLSLENHSWGHPNHATAKAMADYILTAVTLVKESKIDAICTCPISKKSLQQAGYLYPGHTEMLVDLTQATTFTMMMAGSSLKVTLATIHCSLKTVPAQLTIDSIHELITITYRSLQMDFGIQQPHLAVAGLNPHSGEEGLFGSEEKEIIVPAVKLAQQDGIHVSGPYPPDTIFFQASAGKFDGVVCMYHDQGLIPFKLLHFQDGVNVTLGLPLVRTSVDHGTAYDIAGKGIADATSLKEAVAMAADISRNRKLYSELKQP